MKKHRMFNITIFTITIISIPLFYLILFLLAKYNNDPFFGEFWVEKNCWLVLSLLPFYISIFIYGIILKKRKMRYIIFLIAALINSIVIIIIPLLSAKDYLLFHDSNINQITNIEEKINIELPHSVELHKYNEIDKKNFKCDVSVIKIIDISEKEKLDTSTQIDERWTNRLQYSILSSFSYQTYCEYKNSDYFLFYINELDSYNKYPKENGTYTCMFVFYNQSIGKIIVSDCFELVVN